MKIDDKSLEQLKAMVYDEAQKLAIAQNNIKVLEEEINKRSQESEQ